MSKIILKENEDIPTRLVFALHAAKRSMGFFLRFATFQTTVEKVDFVSNLLKTYEILPKFIKDIKNNERAVELRKEGNIFFTQRKDEDALKSYTHSIANAIFSTEELGLAYANRSAVLFRLKLYQECLEDIQRALLNDYPEKLKLKLLERQKNAEDLKSKQQKMPYHQRIPKIAEKRRNATIECASNSVEIKNDATFGRHIIATRDIEIGEIMAVEQAAFTTLTANGWCHCHHCLTLCYCLIPCESCTTALFCSNICRNAAKKYHDFECPILATVHSFVSSSCGILPLRIAILMKNEYHNLYDNVGINGNTLYMSGCYKDIHNLVTSEKLRTDANLFESVVTVSSFYYLVKNYTKFFESFDGDSENIFKRLVLHHLQTMACNFYAIEDLEWNPEHQEYELQPIGVGAFGFSSLFNHSCAANIGRVNYGINIVLSAMESIKKGEQLFVNYGFHFGMDPRDERQAALKKHYFFDCRCRACENNWGTNDTLPTLNSESNILMNQNELAIIAIALAIALADLNVARKLEPDLRCAAMKLQKKAPCKEYFSIQELLRQFHRIFGNIRRSF